MNVDVQRIINHSKKKRSLEELNNRFGKSPDTSPLRVQWERQYTTFWRTHLKPKYYEVEEDGVLGSQFFTDNDVNISKCLEIKNDKYPFRNPETTIFPSRSISNLCIRVKNMNKKRFIPFLFFKQGQCTFKK